VLEFDRGAADQAAVLAATRRKQLRQERSAYDTGADLFGRHGSGRRDLSERRKGIFNLPHELRSLVLPHC